GAVVVEDAVLEHRAAGQVDGADGVVAGVARRAVVVECDGDGAVVDGGGIDGQGAERVDGDVAVGVVHRAGEIDGERAVGQHLDQPGVGDVLVVEFVAGAGGVDGAVVVEDAVLEHRAAGQVDCADGVVAGVARRAVVVECDGDGAVVDGGGIDGQGAERVDGDVAVGVVHRAGEIDGERAVGQHLDQPGVGDVLVVEFVAGAGGVDGAVVVEDAVLEHRAAGQVDCADGVVAGVARRAVVVECDGDGAVVDGGGIDGQGAERVDGDVAVGVVHRAGEIDGERAVGQHLDQPGVGDVLVVEFVAGAGGVDGAVVVEDAVLEHRAAGQVDCADGVVAGVARRAVVVECDGDGAVVDGGGIDGQGAERVDGDVAVGVVHRAGEIDGERAVGQHLDQPGVGDVLVVEFVAGAGGVDGAVVVEDAVLEHRAAGQVDCADGVVAGVARRAVVVECDGDGAVVDGGGIDGQGAERVDGDGGVGVVPRAGEIDGERAVGQHLDQPGVVERVVLELEC